MLLSASPRIFPHLALISLTLRPPRCTSRCGPDGLGYKIELPKKWLMENRKFIDDGYATEEVRTRTRALARLAFPEAVAIADVPTSIPETVAKRPGFIP